MTTHLETAREVVAVLGGPTKVSDRTGRSLSAVSYWQTKYNSFPSCLYLRMQRWLITLDCSAPAHLWDMEEPDDW